MLGGVEVEITDEEATLMLGYIKELNELTAMVKKAQSSNIATINRLIDQVFGDISTSFSNADLLALAANIFVRGQ